MQLDAEAKTGVRPEICRNLPSLSFSTKATWKPFESQSVEPARSDPDRAPKTREKPPWPKRTWGSFVRIFREKDPASMQEIAQFVGILTPGFLTTPRGPVGACGHPPFFFTGRPSRFGSFAGFFIYRSLSPPESTDGRSEFR